MTGAATVPQIFFNGRHLGGNSDFQAIQGTELEELIEWVKSTEPDDNTPRTPDESLLLTDHDINDNEFVCEPDQLAKIAQKLKDSKLPQKRLKGLKSYSGAFTGKQLIEWLGSQSLDLNKGQELLDANFIRPVKGTPGNFTKDVMYQMTEHTNIRALNSGAMASCKSPSPAELGEQLRKQIKAKVRESSVHCINFSLWTRSKLIYASFLNDEGTRVDYDGIKKSEVFATYEKLAQQLQRVNIAELDENGKLAFFINIYNALIIHGQVRLGIPPSFLARLRFFASTSYIIGGYAFSLDEIENGVLRANRRSPAAIFKPFSKGDGRLEFAMKQNEPLIHFALVCGAKSCPPIKCYTQAWIKVLIYFDKQKPYDPTKG